MKYPTLAAVVLPAALLILAPGCAHLSPSPARPGHVTQTRALQEAMTPDRALAALKAGNERYVSGQTLARDVASERVQTSAGQFPFAAVVSCIDSRTPAELIFDRAQSTILRTRIETGQVGLVGGIYDLNSGQVRFLESALAATPSN